MLRPRPRVDAPAPPHTAAVMTAPAATTAAADGPIPAKGVTSRDDPTTKTPPPPPEEGFPAGARGAFAASVAALLPLSFGDDDDEEEELSESNHPAGDRPGPGAPSSAAPTRILGLVLEDDEASREIAEGEGAAAAKAAAAPAGAEARGAEAGSDNDEREAQALVVHASGAEANEKTMVGPLLTQPSRIESAADSNPYLKRDDSASRK